MPGKPDAAWFAPRASLVIRAAHAPSANRKARAKIS
jgi:hypothetical protein